MNPSVVAVHQSTQHEFSKTSGERIRLLLGQGVEGDAHCGVTVKHRSRVAVDPTQPNLRQVHLLQAELFDELAARGLMVAPGQMGENITTRRIDLLSLPQGTKLMIGAEAVVELTGLRNPCGQIENFLPGLLAAVLDRGPEGQLIRKAGVMGVVLAGGEVKPRDQIRIELPQGEQRPLERV
ncbi:MOSC domain-containing protein [Roseateles oligotrophus]|uniref:MOSC domain-containing protein n=1 Tax=Roseateles oligotrophus TaxID=1769250 RepID=A0ABT2YDJ7_9BURK|nr:MOSC domain-containing protein [Roseateles oligotrophus]MCV2368112.1 MOSC domain-containing protein [Roseateles oligotrophus]